MTPAPRRALTIDDPIGSGEARHVARQAAPGQPDGRAVDDLALQVELGIPREALPLTRELGARLIRGDYLALRRKGIVELSLFVQAQIPGGSGDAANRRRTIFSTGCGAFAPRLERRAAVGTMALIVLPALRRATASATKRRPGIGRCYVAEGRPPGQRPDDRVRGIADVSPRRI